MELTKEDNVLEVMPRESWGALTPTTLEPLVLPASYVFFSSTGTNECLTHYECVKELASIQKTDMKKTVDIKFNFLVNGNGTVYEGRGWENKPKTPVRYYEVRFTSLYIGFIGSFDAKPPLKTLKLMFEIKNKLIRFGMDNNYIDKQIVEIDLENLQKFATLTNLTELTSKSPVILKGATKSEKSGYEILSKSKITS